MMGACNLLNPLPSLKVLMSLQDWDLEHIENGHVLINIVFIICVEDYLKS